MATPSFNSSGVANWLRRLYNIFNNGYDFTRRGGIYVNQQMPSHGLGRIKHTNNVRMTASGLLGSWTLDHLHWSSLVFSGLNASSANSTHFRIREGSLTGPIKFHFQHGTGAIGAPEHFEQGLTWDEHPIFHGESTPKQYYLEVVTGTLTINFNIEGYDSSTA